MASSDTLAQRIEWLLGVASALLVLALAGYLVHEATGPAGTLPDLAVVLADEPAPQDQVRFMVTNHGGRTAQSVTVSLTLDRDGAPAMRRSLTIDYVPAHSQATGGFILPPGARGLDPALAVEGYLDP
jgi:uncharacterized protein (TIGR02588 family)